MPALPRTPGTIDKMNKDVRPWTETLENFTPDRHVPVSWQDPHSKGPAARQLSLNIVQRTYYQNMGSLSVDASGHEHLLGLTPDESAFVARVILVPPASLTNEQRQRLASLVVEHERARLRQLSYPAPAKNETRQG
jgi:hypothetical protein